MKIATHDSATGERPTWWSALLTPFARTQGKTVKEQLECGCTMFDIRVKKVFGTWRCAHGWWFTKKTAEEIFRELSECEKDIHVLVTFEGKTGNADGFIDFISGIKGKYPNIHYGAISSKYGKGAKGLRVKYDVLIAADEDFTKDKTRQGFLPLDGRWQTYIPIPWLWKKIYNNKPEFNDDIFTFVDFL